MEENRYKGINFGLFIVLFDSIIKTRNEFTSGKVEYDVMYEGNFENMYAIAEEAVKNNIGIAAFLTGIKLAKDETKTKDEKQKELDSVVEVERILIGEEKKTYAITRGKEKGVTKEDIERMFKAVEIVQTELAERTALEAERTEQIEQIEAEFEQQAEFKHMEQAKAELIKQFKTEVAQAKVALELDLIKIGWKGIRF